MGKDPFSFNIEEKKVDVENKKKTSVSVKKTDNINIKVEQNSDSIKEKYEKMPIEKLMSIYYIMYEKTIRKPKSVIVDEIIKGLNMSI